MSGVELARGQVPVEYPPERSGLFGPAPKLAEWREQSPICPLRYPDGHVGWLVTGHALGRAVLGDPRFNIRPLRLPVGDAGLVEAIDAGAESAGDMLIMDPPEHTRLRRLQTRFFTVRRMAEHRSAIERIVEGRLDEMERSGSPVDLIEAFALPVPAMTICELLGVPHADRAIFERPTAALMAGAASSADEKLAAMKDFYEYARRVIEQKRAEPRDDLLSELVATGELTDDELAGVAFFLFGAGHHTTSSLIGLSILCLLHERDRWESLLADPHRIEPAVEELLRYLTINAFSFARTPTEDVALDGLAIKAGESVTVSMLAANRDPDVYEQPDLFDPGRRPAGHLAFGYGRHMCLGQHLARLELEVCLAGLTRRFPALRLAVPAEEIELRGETEVYRAAKLPVAW